MNTEGLKIWMTKINLDEANQSISGYLNIATSVEDVYTARIIFRSKWQESK